MSKLIPSAGRSIGLCLLLPAASWSQAPSKEAKPRSVRVYTNDDLERVHPYAAQTGGGSATGEPPEADTPADADERRGRGERYWRDEATRVREKIRGLEEKAASLRSRIAERRRASPVYGRKSSGTSGASAVASLEASLAAVEKRILGTQDDLEERARRDGALPGWLR